MYQLFIVGNYSIHIWVFPKIGVPQNGWFIMENPVKMDDLGVSLFSETPILVGLVWEDSDLSDLHFVRPMEHFLWVSSCAAKDLFEFQFPP